MRAKISLSTNCGPWNSSEDWQIKKFQQLKLNWFFRKKFSAENAYRWLNFPPNYLNCSSNLFKSYLFCLNQNFVMVTLLRFLLRKILIFITLSRRWNPEKTAKEGTIKIHLKITNLLFCLLRNIARLYSSHILYCILYSLYSIVYTTPSF